MRARRAAEAAARGRVGEQRSRRVREGARIVGERGGGGARAQPKRSDGGGRRDDRKSSCSPSSTFVLAPVLAKIGTTSSCQRAASRRSAAALR